MSLTEAIENLNRWDRTRIRKRALSLQQCARTELGPEVDFAAKPIKFYEFHWSSYRPTITAQRERAHFITLVYACQLPEYYLLESHNQAEGQAGYLQWFDDTPEGILPILKCYRRN